MEWAADTGIFVGMSEDSISHERVFKTGEIVAGRFVIAELIGRGAMGSVYRAFNSTLQQDVALKIIHADLIDLPKFKARFLREARALAAVGDDNLVRIYSSGTTDDGLLFMALEYLPGETLQDLIAREGALLPQQAVRLAVQICRGMAKAHDVGVIHRDLKPANISITESNQAKVLDFGIATNVDSSDQALTVTGTLIGSPAYMSPEQCKGMEVDARSDVYSLGCVLFEMLCGKPPFQADTALAAMSDHLEKSVTLVPAPNAIPLRLQDIVLQCLAKDPDQRFQSMSELSRELVAVDWDSLKVTAPLRRTSKRRQMVQVIAAACAVIALPPTFLLVSNAKNAKPHTSLAAVIGKTDAPGIAEEKTSPTLKDKKVLQEEFPDPLDRVRYYQKWIAQNEHVDKFSALQAYYQLALDCKKARAYPDRAAAARARVIELSEGFLQAEPEKLGPQLFLKVARERSEMLQERNDCHKAIDTLKDAIGKVGKDARDRDVVETDVEIAKCLIRLKEYAGAEALLRKSETCLAQRAENSRVISTVLVKLSEVLHKNGKSAEAALLLKGADAKMCWQNEADETDYEARANFLTAMATALSDHSHFSSAADLFMVSAEMFLQTRKGHHAVAAFQSAAFCFQACRQSKLAEQAFGQALKIANDTGGAEERWQIVVSMIRTETEEQLASGSIAKVVQRQLSDRVGGLTVREGTLQGLIDVGNAASCCGDQITANKALKLDAGIIFGAAPKDPRAFGAIIPVCSLALKLRDTKLAAALLREHKKRFEVVDVPDSESQKVNQNIQEAILLSLEGKDASVDQSMTRALKLSRLSRNPELMLDVIDARVACCGLSLLPDEFLDMANMVERHCDQYPSLSKSRILSTLTTLTNGAYVRGLDGIGNQLLVKSRVMSKSTHDRLFTVDSIYCDAADACAKNGDYAKAYFLYELGVKSRELGRCQMGPGRYAKMLKGFAFVCQRSGKPDQAQKLLREAEGLT